MPFLKLDGLNSIKELQQVPEGEYDLTIGGAEEKLSKKKKPMIQLSIQIESADYPNAETIFEFINLPHEEDEPRTKEFKLRQAKRILTAFDIDFDDGFDTEDLVGAKSTQQVGTRELVDDDGKAYVPPRHSNYIKWPRFGDEEEETEAVDTRVNRKATGSGRKRR